MVGFSNFDSYYWPWVGGKSEGSVDLSLSEVGIVEAVATKIQDSQHLHITTFAQNV